MRKDVHVGLAIGGVLLAVLIVWGVVVSGSRKTKPTVSLDTTNSSPSDHGAGEIPPPIAASASDSHPADTSAPHATGTGVTAPPAAPSSSAPPAATPAPSTSDPLPPAQVSDKKEVNWQALLVGTPTDAATAAAPSLLASQSESGSNGTSSGGSNNGASNSAGTGGNDRTLISPDPTSTTGHLNPEPAAATPPAESSARTHKVQSGETFSSIAKAVYGEKRYYTAILKANPKVDPTKLKPGTIITLPDLSAIKTESNVSAVERPAGNKVSRTGESASRATPTNPTSEYRVASGDSLYRISEHLYGSPEEVDHLYELNKSTIGSDPKRLKVGMVLKLPAPPTMTATASR